MAPRLPGSSGVVDVGFPEKYAQRRIYGSGTRLIIKEL